MILVVAWDGACFDVVRPLLDAGDLPVLASLLEKGASRDLESTVPAVTFPAWSSFLTAAGPDHHGLTDFTKRDGYAVRFMNATHRRLPSLFAVMDAAGRRCGSYAVPCTYPPDPINGLIVCGFDTPLGTGRAAERTHPKELAGRLQARHGGLAVDGPQQSKIEDGWHEEALARMREEIALRTRVVIDLLGETGGGASGEWDLFMVHYGESDTVSHQFWQFADPSSPRYRDDGPADAIAEVYRLLDRSLGELLDALPEEASVMLVSDHGSGGASDRVVHWNRWLAEKGWLRFGAGGTGAMRLARQGALRLLPTRLQATLFESLPGIAGRVESGCRLGGIDWSATRVFSEELNYFPGLWLNRRGREPQGIVDDGEVEQLVVALTAELEDFVDPFDGERVVRQVLRREEIYQGPYASRIPDLVLELRDPDGYSYAGASSRGGAEGEAIRRLGPEEMTGARGTTMPGAHRPLGLCVMSGPRIRPGRYPVGTLADAGATVLALDGLVTAPGADGRPWLDIVGAGEDELEAGPEARVAPVRNYQADDEQEVAKRLRALGYVE